MSCPKEYKCSDRGLILPITNESDWPTWVRVCVYSAGLIYCFMGIAIIADIFMCAIEKITSSTRKIKESVGDSKWREVEVRVWNDTVANLTLMALGSSAPEILLSLIEIVGNKMKNGKLGPSTIVGSAAFNLLVITAVCIIALPKDATRTIKEVNVFILTSFFSVMAYVWLFFILKVSSKNEVKLWEAVITLMLFPVLVLLAYVLDKGICKKKRVADLSVEDPALTINGDQLDLASSRNSGHVDKTQVAKILQSIGDNADVTPEVAAQIVSMRVQEEMPHSRAWHRVSATRSIMGVKKTNQKIGEDLIQTLDKLKHRKESCSSHNEEFSESDRLAVIEFTTTTCAIFENEQLAHLTVRRCGCMSSQVVVSVETFNGTAEAGSDYIPLQDTLTFDPNESQKQITIEIIDDDVYEEDETFFVKLFCSDPAGVIGKKGIATVIIMNDDEPGTLEFEQSSFLVKGSSGFAKIPIIRQNGNDGEIEISYKTEDISSKDALCYELSQGLLKRLEFAGKIKFLHGESKKEIEIKVLPDELLCEDPSFQLTLYNPTNGAQLGKKSSTVVTIVNDKDYNKMLESVVLLANVDLDKMNVTSQTWASQFHEAMNVNGGDYEEASTIDYILHFINFFWKVLFAFVPPPRYLDGWACFFISLVMIGILTAIVSDLAAIFGCLLGMHDSVTAITFVALGTSLPDLFASKQAAINDKHADNAVGNVTGSNSVNVFLGLGLPWTVAAIYWGIKKEKFVVDADSLSFSVALYAGCAAVCLFLIFLRRILPLNFAGKSELGGPMTFRIVSFLILIGLWIFYVTMSVLQSYDIIKGF